MSFECEEVADHPGARDRRQQAHFSEGIAGTAAECLTVGGCGLDRVISGPPADVTGAEKRHHVCRKQQLCQALRIASGIGVLEVRRIPGLKIDQSAAHGCADAPQRSRGRGYLERRELHEPYILLRGVVSATAMRESTGG